MTVLLGEDESQDPIHTGSSDSFNKHGKVIPIVTQQ
jgi:hypothetical protein